MNPIWLFPAFAIGAIIGIFIGAYIIWIAFKEESEKADKEIERLQDRLKRNEDSWCEMISVACGSWQRTIKESNEGWQKRFDELERLRDTEESPEPVEDTEG